ncbi:MAG: hypothetical protein EA397_02905 [Deltaproteobacteria bacterium]|nr:MAG: hypothetical protein EA397_02905 [Deltaproteobacteria bacterium]
MRSKPVALALALLATPAFAGVPGEDKPVVSGLATAVYDADARDPLAIGGELRAAFPFDLELRGRLLHTRTPPRSIEDFMRANPEPSDAQVPESLAYSRWESRLQAFWSLDATERETGPRVRAGALGVIAGTSGASRRLGPIGWSPDYTASFQLGPSAAVGWATPLRDTPEAALLDVRLGGSLAMPITAGGGRLSISSEDRAFALTVDDDVFSPSGLLGRESRAWVEGTLIHRRLIFGLEVGLEHNARSAVRRARAGSPNWNIEDTPERVAPHAAVQFGLLF